MQYLLFQWGIKCTGSGLVRAGGTAVIGYAEKAKIYARESIEIRKYAFNRIYSKTLVSKIYIAVSCCRKDCSSFINCCTISRKYNNIFCRYRSNFFTISSLFQRFANGEVIENEIIASGIRPTAGKDAEITLHFGTAVIPVLKITLPFAIISQS